MDSNLNDLKVPVFNCNVKQDCNSIFVPVPYGTLETFVRSVLAHNEGTFVEVIGLETLNV